MGGLGGEKEELAYMYTAAILVPLQFWLPNLNRSHDSCCCNSAVGTVTAATVNIFSLSWHHHLVVEASIKGTSTHIEHSVQHLRQTQDSITVSLLTKSHSAM